jgi:hypothetical protein
MGVGRACDASVMGVEGGCDRAVQICYRGVMRVCWAWRVAAGQVGAEATFLPKCIRYVAVEP